MYQAKAGHLIPEKFYYYAYYVMSIKHNFMSNKLDTINVKLKFTSVRRKAMNKELINDTCDAAALPKKNTLRLFFWGVAWVLATAGTAFGPKFLWDFNTLPTMLGVLIHIGIGFGMIRMFRQYLLRLDELQRKIQLDAMAQSLGVGLVVGVSYEMLEDIKLITFEPEISHLILLMSLTYCIGIILGNRRYQ